MISRKLEEVVKDRIGKGKAIIVLGPRQVGKTTLLRSIAEKKGNYLFLNGDDPIDSEKISTANTESLKQIIGKHELVFIDEAQRIKDIGIKLKLITDRFKNVQLLISGSSALDLSGKINEPLTGRKWEYQMHPVSWEELSESIGQIAAESQLESRIIYGMYPEVCTRKGEEKELLHQLCESYLYKDLLSLEGIRKPDLLEKLLRAIALQLGQEVSYNELATLLHIDKATVQSYIHLLERVFVIFTLQPFSRNLRNEITSSRKIYFYDTGIRNTLIANYNPLSMRQDTGALWENFLLSERMKLLHYSKKWSKMYFWRTHAQQEIDYIEERDGKLHAYEFKWKHKPGLRIPKNFLTAYPDAGASIITRDNFTSFLNQL